MMRPLRPNAGIPLDLHWVSEVRANSTSILRRASALATAYAIREESRRTGLLRAVSCMDLTTLSDDDTDERVRRLCARALQPLPAELLERLGLAADGLKVAAVCIYHRFIGTARQALAAGKVKVAVVSADFPLGLAPLDERVAEIRGSVEAGADEIDVVIHRAHVLSGNWRALYDEVAAFRAACGSLRMKVILSTGELRTLRNVARASLVCMMAGAHFIKTSTGKEAVKATLPAGLAMADAIRDYAQQTGMSVGLKPAGGIRTATQALEWLVLVREELGEPWLEPNLFRIGASSLLDDIERQLALPTGQPNR